MLEFKCVLNFLVYWMAVVTFSLFSQTFIKVVYHLVEGVWIIMNCRFFYFPPTAFVSSSSDGGLVSFTFTFRSLSFFPTDFVGNISDRNVIGCWWRTRAGNRNWFRLLIIWWWLNVCYLIWSRCPCLYWNEIP